MSQGPLDGLIITGAPVEHLPFEQVSYWNELVQLIEEARSTCASTLGLCWAGFALAYLAGVDKVAFQQKLFGICLLYTSPSPRDATLSRMPSSA